MWLTRVSVRNPYFAAVLMMTLMVLGLFSWQKLPVEEMPDIRLPIAVIYTPYNGASPEVVESEVSKPLEEALNSVNGIKEMRSYSSEGSSFVVVEFELSVDPASALQSVRDKVASVQGSFRREIGTPTVSQVDPNDNPMMSLSLSSDLISPRELSSWADNVLKKRLQMVGGVGDVSLIGAVRREIRVDIDPVRLEASGLALTDVADAVKAANQDFPAGNVSTAHKEWAIRVSGKLKSADDFAALAVGYRNGTPIRLDDIATVADTVAEQDSVSLVDGKPGLGIDIKAARGSNEVEVAAGVKKLLASMKGEMPPGLKLRFTSDSSEDVKKAVHGVESMLLEGAGLTILIVFLFLGSWRSTVITGLTLPVALVGTLFAIQVLGFSLNVLTLLALSLSIGLLIDDAIVVRENIVRHAALGKSHYQAALDGTNEIGLAVLATTLTVVAVFLPMGFMDGIIGRFFHQFGLTVAVAVLISMFVSFTLDPMLSSIWHDPHHHGDHHRGPLGRMLDWFETSLDRLADRYAAAIGWVLRYRKTTLALALGFTAACFLLATSIGGEFIPETDNGKIDVSYQTAPGSSLEYTTQKGQELANVLSGIKEIKSISLNVGAGNFGAGKNDGSLTLDIGDKSTRQRKLHDVIEDARRRVMPVAGVRIKSVANSDQQGKPIFIGLRGANLAELEDVSREVMAKIGKVKGVKDIESNLTEGDPSLSLSLKRDAALSLGVDLNRVGNLLSMLLAGNVVTTWEAPDGENYDVRLRVPKEERSQELLDQLKVAGNHDVNGAAQMVPLSTLIETKQGVSPRQIKRTNMMREIGISANVEGRDVGSAMSDVDKVLDGIQLPPGVQRMHRGQQKDMEETVGSALRALGLGVIFIYLILAAQFRSFTMPVTIMMALPLAFGGVFVALFLWGSTINMFSIIGIIMLMGLVAKNGILLVDFINRARADGMSREAAIMEAGRVRLRPIMMTSLAMIFGMLPLALGTGEGAESNRPMAHAIIGGLTTSTLLTLLVVPVVYTYMDSLRGRIRKLLSRRKPLLAVPAKEGS
ncbi:efflux RND transporter permease subunit [Chromobacterium paludis]|uniref:Efflux RND transporter permease subunit n=1 Tax=Chromobacterium paludis TaxID=2605945 RepID=A0A5C1DDX9_9NEIS|nr:efflux RND transporter permease subunit [Chromobacterium paludis]QEL54972.1 efflux RND transporter permease subunit [Chromobacterium paludis]